MAGFYSRDGAAILECPTCHHRQRVEWRSGDPDILVPEHCAGRLMRQATHNDGETPIEKPCPSYCCRR